MIPEISVCIPVYDTENYLACCLRSVLLQDFDSFEVIIVSDASCGKDSLGRKAGKIIKITQKECQKERKSRGLGKVPITFIENKENRGIFEVRRTLTTQARGKYICFVDSVDALEAGALKTLYNTADGTVFDIIQAASVSGTFDSEGQFTQSKENRYSNIIFGSLQGREIFSRWLHGDLTGILWAKLFRRELVEKAYSQIPYTECNMADDILLFFYISQMAQNYFGIQTCVYRYRVNSGMSSERKIDTLHKWQLICSSASVFTIFSQAENLSDDDMECLRRHARTYLLTIIQLMERNVIPELREQAYEMLCEWWGKDFVEAIKFASEK